VARRAGVTRAVIYQHYRDLQALLEAVVDRETSRALVQVSETALQDLSEGDPQQLMLESLEAYKEFREDAEAHGMRHFLEIFNPAIEVGVKKGELPTFINDAIVRCLAARTLCSI